MIDEQLRKRIQSHFDRDVALDLLRDAVAIPSVTGSEAAFAEFVSDRLSHVGADTAEIQALDEGRANVWSVHNPGSGDASLLFAGHLDTVSVAGWEEHWQDDGRADPFGAAVVDGHVWGRGVGDVKAGICAVITALGILRSADVSPRRPTTTLFVADEESGEEGSGVSAGIKAALPLFERDLVPPPDFAVYVEPTQLEVFTAQMGFMIADIRLAGKSAYFGTPELGVDALRAGHDVLGALWSYSDSLAERGQHDLLGDPFVLPTATRSGGYIAVPGDCRISLIRKLLPGEDLTQARNELDDVVMSAVRDERVQVDIDYPAGRDHAVGGTALEADPELAAIQTLQAAVKAVTPDRGHIAGAPYWSENPFLTNDVGIPAVYCAPGDIRNCHTYEERVAVDEYFDAIEAFALLIATY